MRGEEIDGICEGFASNCTRGGIITSLCGREPSVRGESKSPSRIWLPVLVWEMSARRMSYSRAKTQEKKRKAVELRLESHFAHSEQNLHLVIAFIIFSR